jgi:hypothetical protein
MDKKNVKLVEEGKYLIKRFPSLIIDISKIKVAEALGIIADVGLIHWVHEDIGFYDRLSGKETIFEFMSLSTKVVFDVITGELALVQ